MWQTIVINMGVRIAVRAISFFALMLEQRAGMLETQQVRNSAKIQKLENKNVKVSQVARRARKVAEKYWGLLEDSE